jgi:hypothetical protein
MLDASERSNNRICYLLAFLVLMVGSSFGQARSANGAMALTVRPAAKLEVSATSIVVKVRLATGSQAYLWAAQDCSSPVPNIIVERSGSYDFRKEDLKLQFADRILCLASSDRQIAVSLPLIAQ